MLERVGKYKDGATFHIFVCPSACSSRNASTLSTSDLLALIIMAQNMYPSNMEPDDPSPEVENKQLLSQLHLRMFPAFLLIIISFCAVKDVESTSGSGPESFYTPEPSPTDRSSSSSGTVCMHCIYFSVPISCFLNNRTYFS